VYIKKFELINFRNYSNFSATLSSCCTAIVGENGQGKTNLIEALGYLGSRKSFRGVHGDALVRVSCERATVRALVVHDDSREILLETDISLSSKNKFHINGSPLKRSRDLFGLLRVTVFSPEDLQLIQGGPSMRRTFLDEILLNVSSRHERLQQDLDRVLRQRLMLLKQLNRSKSQDSLATLDVWDSRLILLANEVVSERKKLLDLLAPHFINSYNNLAQNKNKLFLSYAPKWFEDGYDQVLIRTRNDDIQRCVTTVGPHRDDIDITLNELPSRTHASQGEQRCLALALRLASHEFITDLHNEKPVLFLDDVLSELDKQRSDLLIKNIPSGQVLITTVSNDFKSYSPDEVINIRHGERGD
jgi:DNA replication and repair protein RecF